MEMKNGRLIVVLGMGRSGTSVLARSLLALGVELGNNLMPPGFDNPKGYWEDLDIVELNNEILYFLKSDWHFLTPIQSKDVDALIRNGYLSRAVEILQKKMVGTPIFGFKDPRLSKLLAFWKEVFAFSQLKVGYILTIRHPLSVCKSLAKRNGFEFEKSYLLWLEQVISSFAGTEGENRVVVDYDRLVLSPEIEMARIAQKFQLKINPGELEKFELEFIEYELRHTIYQSNDLMLDEAAPILVQEVYSRSLDIAADKARMEDASFKTSIKKWSQELSQLKSALVLADKLGSRIVEREKAVQALSVQVAEKEQVVQGLSTQVAEKEQSVQALSTQVAEKEQSMQALSAQVAEQQQSVQALSAQVAEKEQSMQALMTQVAEQQQSVQALSAQVAEKEQSMQALMTQVAEKEQSVQALAGQYHEITISKAWKIALLFRRIRVLLAPPDSHRARLLGRSMNVILFPLKKIRRNRRLKEDLSLIRSSGLFDETWYLTHYPDVAQVKVDPLSHFLRWGGFEGRDPGPDFSSAWYFDTYEDVKKAGINPLVHYLKYGREEGRKPQPTLSTQTLSINVASESDNWGKMKFGLVTIIKNEQDILNTFLNHIDALFDYVLLIDHRSDDNTGYILRKAANLRKNWTYISLNVNGFYQKEISKLGMKYLFESGVDFVFFLDCDEFIQVESRKDIELKVRGLINPPVAGSFRWINCLPDDIESQQFDHNSKILEILEDSQYSKVIIPRSLYDQYEGNLFLLNGNHQVLDSNGQDLGSKEIGHIIHLPIRSRKQLIQKAITDSLTHFTKTITNVNESFQYFEILKMIANRDMSDEFVRGCIHLYQNVSKVVPLSKRDLTNGGYSATSLNNLKVATSQKFSIKFPPENEQLLLRIMANQILHWERENPENLIYDQKEGKILIGKKV